MVYPVIYKVSTIQSAAGFRNHPPYDLLDRRFTPPVMASSEVTGTLDSAAASVEAFSHLENSSIYISINQSINQPTNQSINQSNQIKSIQIKSNQIKPNQINQSNQIKIKSNQSNQSNRSNQSIKSVKSIKSVSGAAAGGSGQTLVLSTQKAYVRRSI